MKAGLGISRNSTYVMQPSQSQTAHQLTPRFNAVVTASTIKAITVLTVFICGTIYDSPKRLKTVRHNNR
jgi:hypothetical protein